MRCTRFVIAFALVAASACAVWDSAKGLIMLSAAISKEFGGQDAVDLSAQGRLTVTFKNSDAANLPPGEREKFARLVAEFVVAHYARIDSVNTVAVGFKSEHGALGVSVSSSSTPYAWSVRVLRAALDSLPARPDTAKRP